MTTTLLQQLALPRCPHCGVDTPTLFHRHDFGTKDVTGYIQRHWAIYSCKRCGGVVTASSIGMGHPMQECFPTQSEVNESIPETPRQYLIQAINSRHAPAGAVMLAASAVDAMLKAKGYTTGSLYSRIDQAAKDNLITVDMAKWAHEVRLEANDQRHADTNAALPTSADAVRVVEFVEALGEFLFVLPARVKRGLQSVGT